MECQGIGKERRNSNYISDSNNCDEENLFYKEDFIQKLVYLLDIFEKLSTLNKSVQGP
jgi:hypothetical protein